MKKLVLASLLFLSLSLAQTWEYGLYQVSASGSSVTHQWIADGETTEPKTNADTLLTELAGRTSRGDLGPRLSVFNYLGEQGWELIFIESLGTNITYIFKRPMGS